MDNNLVVYAQRGDLKRIKRVFMEESPVDLVSPRWISVLFMASTLGHNHIIKFLSKHMSQEEFFEYCKHSALILACYQNRPTTVKILITCMGTDPLIREESNGETAFMVGCRIGSWRIVKFLSNYLETFDTVDFAGRNALMYACKEEISNLKIVSYLLAKNAGIVNAVDLNEQTALMFACCVGRLSIIQSLINAGAGVNMTDVNGRTALTYAVERNHKKVVKLLHRKGANLDFISKGPQGRSAIFMACERQQEQMLLLLLELGANVFRPSRNGKISLLADACRVNCPGIVKKLMDYGFKHDLDIHFFTNPLEFASLHGSTNIVTVFLQHNICSDLRNKGCLTKPLSIACKAGHLDIVELIVNYDETLVDAVDSHRMTPLHYACKGGHKQVANFLIELEADMDAITNNNVTALMLACESGSHELVKDLLHLNVNVNAVDSQHETALIKALNRQNFDALRVLLWRGVNVCISYWPLILTLVVTNNDACLMSLVSQKYPGCIKHGSRKALKTSIRMGNVNMVEALINLGADVLWKDVSSSVLNYAVLFRQTAILKMLLNLECVVEIMNSHFPSGSSALEISAGFLDLNNKFSKYFYKQLLKGNVFSSAASKTIVNRRRALQYILPMEHHGEIIAQLLKAGIEIDCNEDYVRLLLTNSCKLGLHDVVTLLIERKIDWDVYDRNGYCPLLMALENNHFDIACLLIENGGADVNLRHLPDLRHNMKSALMYACAKKHERLFNLILQNGGDVNLTDQAHKTALMYAVEKGAVEFANRLIDKTENIAAQSKDGVNVFMLACQYGRVGIVKKSLCWGSDVTNEILQSESGANFFSLTSFSLSLLLTCDKSGKSPLMYACENGHYEIAEFLIQCGATVNACDSSKDCRTVLSYALINGREDVGCLLLKNGANINSKIKDGMTVLMFSCSKGMISVVTELLNQGVDIKAQNCFDVGKTAFFYACIYDDDALAAKMVKELLRVDKKSCATACDALEKSILMYSAEQGNLSVVKVLVKVAGVVSDIDECDKSNKTALIYAAGNEHSEILEILVHLKADVNVQDDKGATGLIHAVRRGCLKAVEVLINCGNIKLNSKDSTGNTALFYACSDGNEEIVRALLFKNVSVDSQNYFEQTALMAACKNGHSSILHLLLVYGANYKLVDKDGNSAMYYACDNGNPHLVKTLLHKARINHEPEVWKDHKVLMCACLKGYQNIVGLLLRAGVSVNCQDAMGYTPLMKACGYGSEIIAKQLLHCGADVNLKSRTGLTALIVACQANHGNVEIVKLLLKGGARINDVDDSNQSALFYAICLQDVELTGTLLSHKANPNIVNNEGKTAFSFCCGYWNMDLITHISLPLSQRQLYKQRCRIGDDVFEELCHLLLNHGASINSQASDGTTALMWLASYNQDRYEVSQWSVDLFKRFLKLEVNCDVKDSDGNTVFTHAMKGGKDLLELLVLSGKLFEKGTKRLKRIHKQACLDIKLYQEHLIPDLETVSVTLNHKIFEWSFCNYCIMPMVAHIALQLGMSPGFVDVDGIKMSPLIRAIIDENHYSIDFFVTHFFFLPEDLETLRQIKQNWRSLLPSQSVLQIMESDSFSLQTLCLLAISQAIAHSGPPSERRQMVDKLPIPDVFKRKLKFEGIPLFNHKYMINVCSHLTPQSFYLYTNSRTDLIPAPVPGVGELDENFGDEYSAD